MTGKSIQNMLRDGKGEVSYSGIPHYITEDIIGDICESDYYKQAVIVLKKIRTIQVLLHM